MAYKTVSFDKRIEENIKNYSLDNLLPLEQVGGYLETIAELTGVSLLLTGRHGEKFITVGTVQNEKPDVVNDPGKKIRVFGRTVGHLYIEDNGEDTALKEKMFVQLLELLSQLGEQTYLHVESAFYIDELEEKAKEEIRRQTHREKEDPLTGVYNKTYFEKRMEIVDRSEVIPVAIVNCNINDWKFVNDHFGDEQSDRLIKVIAGIIKEQAKPDYVIGRVDGDVFITLIPMAEDGEAENYVNLIQTACEAYEDDYLAPSVACGIVYKTNVEECIRAKLSDAEYEMFENKFQVKNAAGYRERLESKVQK